MRILKRVVKGFVIVVVVCFALVGAFKIFKPAPVIDVPKDDLLYLETIGINVAEGGKASDSGASPLFGDVEGALPLNSTGSSFQQSPPASLGGAAGGGFAPAFGTTTNDDTNSPAPPFNPNNSPTKLSNNALPNELGSAPVLNYGQETTVGNDPFSSNVPSPNSLPQPPTTTSNPTLTANLNQQFEPQTIEPSSPYASQHIAPPLIASSVISSPVVSSNLPVPASIAPSAANLNLPYPNPNSPYLPYSPLAPTRVNPFEQQVPPPFTPTDNSPNTSSLSPCNNNTEAPTSTLPTTPAMSVTELPKLLDSTVSFLPPVGNQTLTPPTPVIQVDPPPSPPLPPAVAATYYDSQHLPDNTGLPSAFVNTGLRDDAAAINQNNTQNSVNNNPFHTITNSFTPATQINPELTKISNDPNYYSSAVPIAPLFYSTSPLNQANISFSSETVVIENNSYQQEFSSDILFAIDSVGDKSAVTASVKLLPLVVDSADQDRIVVVDSGNRYVRFNDSNANSQKFVRDMELPRSSSMPENGLSLWADYLKSVKQNNEAVLAPTREMGNDVAAKVAFAKEEPNMNDNFMPSYGTSSPDIFPVFADSGTANNSSDNSSGNSAKPTSKTNVENPFAESSRQINGVIATSSSELMDNAIAGLDAGNGNNSDSGGNYARNRDNEKIKNIAPNKSVGISTDAKLENVSAGNSAPDATIPFVQPPPVPQPVIVTNDLTTSDIFSASKPQEHSSPQSVREMASRFVTGQMREYETRENAKMHLALVRLSKFYDQQDLRDVERDYVAGFLDRVALELIYSSGCHVLEPMYRVKLGDTVESVAKQYGISAALLSKINGLNPSEVLLTGKELKVVHGQFDAKVHTKRGELTLLLGGVYAGRFPVVIGRNVIGVTGEFVVQSKSTTTQSKHLMLNNGIEINGLGRRITPNSLGVSQENIEELFDILTENSVIVLEE
ncbi:MAG: LysM peptidoglycan-binding domain-containing protein [Planctomycetaceae bacterium]|nr:LysM peptidoglycan-binding domain-containing protein [Planctomycetaceae bacterium]